MKFFNNKVTGQQNFLKFISNLFKQLITNWNKVLIFRHIVKNFIKNIETVFC